MGAETVGKDSAEDDQTGEGGGRRGRGEADRTRPVPVLEQSRGECDGQRRVAQPGHGTGGEEQAEGPR
ncbi:hypothetical protein, partial [Streptomyces sp. A13(2022)]|uniref:hypothetical protein n=1 Tax=Streptomyces sp. A13(2022) TaxID=2964768 RepID=UPI0021D9CCAE